MKIHSLLFRTVVPVPPVCEGRGGQRPPERFAGVEEDRKEDRPSAPSASGRPIEARVVPSLFLIMDTRPDEARSPGKGWGQARRKSENDNPRCGGGRGCCKQRIGAHWS
ncbi:hypothetical protein CEXT_654581 [Caerostris extrusa]|uniref:Uncharacterized protein n=1 Tax=Caerostris extrusa TaxID=172846 RepID=A0AAV4PHT5_CAEEX|nr:hypothetical protein CEXT_654581 [Caerostris extrusa]